MKECFNENRLLEGHTETKENDFQKFRDIVNNFYIENDVDEGLIEQFIEHNRQVETFVERFSDKENENFNERETEIAILAAIFHDITKGWGDFLNHGKDGGEIAEKILRENGVSDELARSVKLAIERHMGEEGYPSRMAKNHFGEEFSYPAYQTRVAQMVYECDILTQLTQKGFEKILLLREKDEECQKEDKKVAREKGITQGEASMLSALESAKESSGFIKMASIKKYATELWEVIEEKYGDILEK